MKLYLQYIAEDNHYNLHFIYFILTLTFICLFIELLIFFPNVIIWKQVCIGLIIWIIPTVFHIKGFIKYSRNKKEKK